MNFFRATILSFAAALLASAPLSASTVIPAKRPAAPVLLRGGTVHTVSGAVLPDTDVLLIDGKIAHLGGKVKAPTNTQVVDATGKHIYPGFISANSQVGLAETLSVQATVDTAEVGPVNPNARTQVAVNPDSELIPVTRINGVLTTHAAPLAGGGQGARPAIFAGTSSLIRLDGWTWEDMTIRPAVALYVYWPSMAVATGPAARPADEQRREIAARVKVITDTFAAARAYAGAKTTGAHVPTDLRLEAILPVLRGETKLFIHADDGKQIAAALEWAKREKLTFTLVGGRDSWRLAPQLKEAGVAVILAGTFNLPPRRDDAFDTPYATAAKLHAAGVAFCIGMGTDGASEPGNERNLPYEAALAAAHGLPRDEALKAVTLYPAQLLGVASELGSIEVGKRATLIVTDGDPLEIPTKIEHAFIDGAAIELRSRHTELYEKYRQRYGK